MTAGRRAALLCATACLAALAMPAAAEVIVQAGQLNAVPCVVVAGVEDETAKRAWLGVSITDVTDEARVDLDLGKAVVGALVLEVYDESPAEKAGVQEDDVIVSLAGAKIAGTSDLIGVVNANTPGASIPIVVLRGGKETPLKVTLGERAKDDGKLMWVGDLEGLEGLEALKKLDISLDIPSFELGLSGYFGQGRLGVYIDDLSEGLAQYFGVPDGKGVLVEDVVEGSPAQKGGIQAGDVILRVGDATVEDTGSLREAISEMEPGKETPVVVWRKGKEQTQRVTLEESQEHLARKAYIKALGEGDEARRVIIEATAEDKEALREELAKLKQELKQLKEELKELQEGE